MVKQKDASQSQARSESPPPWPLQAGQAWADPPGKQDYLYFLTIFLLTLRKAGEWRRV